MSGKLLSASGMDIIGIIWCHLVLKLHPPSITFWFHSRTATDAGKCNVLVTVDLFTKKDHFIPLRKDSWLHRLLNLSYSLIPDTMASQIASSYLQPDIRRSLWQISSKPRPRKLWHLADMRVCWQSLESTTRPDCLCQVSQGSPTPAYNPGPHFRSNQGCSYLEWRLKTFQQDNIYVTVSFAFAVVLYSDGQIFQCLFLFLKIGDICNRTRDDCLYLFYKGSFSKNVLILL